MKKTILAFVVLAMIGCGKDEAPAKPAAGSSAAPAATTAAPPATTPAAAATPAPAAPAAQKGLEAGQVIVGYLKDKSDEAQCAALPVPEAEKSQYDAAKIGEVAKMMKSDVVASCPTDNVVGTCKAMGMLVNYSGPKYTKETAQKDCGENRGKWIE
jgi:hypothetical protein